MPLCLRSQRKGDKTAIGDNAVNVAGIVVPVVWPAVLAWSHRCRLLAVRCQEAISVERLIMINLWVRVVCPCKILRQRWGRRERGPRTAGLKTCGSPQVHGSMPVSLGLVSLRPIRSFSFDSAKCYPVLTILTSRSDRWGLQLPFAKVTYLVNVLRGWARPAGSMKYCYRRPTLAKSGADLMIMCTAALASM